MFTTVVKESDLAAFHGSVLHPVYSTFALGRDMEWSSRLFFIEMKDDDEEGVGSYLEIKHLGAALLGDEVTITATVDTIIKNELMCTIEVESSGRTIALGRTGQKMLKKLKLQEIISR